MARSRFAFFLLVISCAFLSACGGGGGGGGSDDSSGGNHHSASADSSAQVGNEENASDDSKPAEANPPAEANVPDSQYTDTSTPNTGSGSTPPATGSNTVPDNPASSDGDTYVDNGTDTAPGTDVTGDKSDEIDPSSSDQDIDLTPEGPPSQNGGASSEEPTVSFQVMSQDGQSQQDVPVTIGQVFTRGDVPQGRTVVAMANGQRVPTQVDKKATWSDGSLRHAVVTVRMNSVEDASTVVSLHTKDAGNEATTLTIDQLLATSFDAVVSIEDGGQTYTVSARDLLYQASANGCPRWGRACKQWLSGPLASEWVVGGTPATNGVPMPNLDVYFNVRAYAQSNGTIDRVRVDFVVENDQAYDSALQNVTYSASLTTGTAHYEVQDLTHYTRARWHRVLWWQGAPNIYAQVDTDYLQQTGAISRYADLTPTDGFLNGLVSQYPPMDNGDQSKSMGNTGAQEAIGPLPRWTSTYVVSGDSRAFHWMLANDDAVGSYGFHYRDEATGRPLDIIHHPYVTIIDPWAHQSHNQKYKRDLLPDYACDLPDYARDCKSPFTFNIAHHPSIGYVPYLVTGDYYYLEEMQFAGSYVELWPNESYRGLDYGRLRGAQSQVRGQAWSLRSLSDAAFATPDDDPLKSYFETMIRNIMADYTEGYLDADPANDPLHIVNQGGSVVYNGGTGIAPWQNDFFVWAMGHAAEQGFTGARELVRWFGSFEIERMTNWLNHSGGYCWTQAAVYAMRVRPSRGAADYTSMEEVYAAMYPDLVNLACNSQEMANLWSGGKYAVGEMSGYAYSPTGFPSNFQIGLAMAVSTNLANATTAWDLFASRSVRPDYNDYPNFAVVPRN